MRIFIVENDPEVMRVVQNLSERGHEVYHAERLGKAAQLLEFHPKVDYFDLFFFDVGIPSERVRHLGDKGMLTYNHHDGFNGLVFLLNNLDILGTRMNDITLITAFKQRVIGLESIDVFGKTFVRERYSKKEDAKRSRSEQQTKLRYVEMGTDNNYALTFIDKSGDGFDALLDRFIHRR